MRETPPMVLEMTGAQSAAHAERGIARYVVEHAAALRHLRPEGVHSLVLNPSLGWSGSLDRFVGEDVLRWNAAVGPGGRALPPGPFIYHVMSPFELIDLDRQLPAYARSGRALRVVTLYDLIPLLFADVYLSDPGLRLRYEARLDVIRGADLVLTISEATAQDAIQHLGLPEEKVVSVGTGVPDWFAPPVDPAATQIELRRLAPRVRPGYIFYTGGVDHRKNIEGLLRAYGRLDAELRARHQLVITCRMQPAARLYYSQVAREAGVRRDVHFTNYVPDDVLLRLYQCARLFVFPSLYEGFGLPLVEAMKAGAPAIGSDRASMREILTDPVHRFDPDDEGQVAALMERGVADAEYRQGLERAAAAVRSRFTWQEVGERSLRAIDDAWDDFRPVASVVHTSSRARIAFFTPLPPQRSGIADYSAAVLDELRRDVDVDVYVGVDPSTVELDRVPGVTVLRASSFPFHRSFRDYAETIYCMGNSEFHGFVFDALAEHPGIVMAHDVRLSGFYAWYGLHERKDPGFFGAALHRMHPTVLGGLAARTHMSPAEEQRHGAWMAEEVIRRSTVYCVHSRYAAELARLQVPDADIRILPFGVTEVPDGEIADALPTRPVVASFGIVHPTKRLDVLLEAAAEVAEIVPDLEIALVGGIGPAIRSEVAGRVEKLGVAERVIMTGHVDRDEYVSWLRRARCAVQLRSHSQGEMSAAVMDCVAHGVPTIVSDIGAGRELPDGVALKLPRDGTAGDLAAMLRRVLTDDAAAGALRREGRRYALGRSFRDVADTLLDVAGIARMPVGPAPAAVAGARTP